MIKNRSVSLMEDRHTPLAASRSTSQQLADIERQSHEKSATKSIKKYSTTYQTNSIHQTPIRNTAFNSQIRNGGGDGGGGVVPSRLFTSPQQPSSTERRSRKSKSIINNNNSSSKSNSCSKSNSKYAYQHFGNQNNIVSTDKLNRSAATFDCSDSKQLQRFNSSSQGMHFNSVDTRHTISNGESQKSLGILTKRKESEMKKIDDLNQLIKLEKESLRRIHSKSLHADYRSFSQSSLMKSTPNNQFSSHKQSRNLTSQSSSALSNTKNSRSEHLLSLNEQYTLSAHRKKTPAINNHHSIKSPKQFYSENKAVQTDYNELSNIEFTAKSDKKINLAVGPDLSGFTFDHIQIVTNTATSDSNKKNRQTSRQFNSAKDQEKNPNHPITNSFSTTKQSRAARTESNQKLPISQSELDSGTINGPPLTTYQRILRDHSVKSAMRKKAQETINGNTLTYEKPIQEKLESIKKELFRDEKDVNNINRFNSNNSGSTKNKETQGFITFERNPSSLFGSAATVTAAGTPITTTTSKASGTLTSATSSTQVSKKQQLYPLLMQQQTGSQPMSLLRNSQLTNQQQPSGLLNKEQINFEKTLRDQPTFPPLTEKNRQKTEQIKKMNSQLDQDAMYLRTLSEMVNRLDKESNHLNESLHRHDSFIQNKLDLQQQLQQQQNELMLLERDQLTVDTAMRRALDELDFWKAKIKSIDGTQASTGLVTQIGGAVLDGYAVEIQGQNGQSNRDSIPNSSSNNTSTNSMTDYPPILIKLDKAEIYNAALLSHSPN